MYGSDAGQPPRSLSQRGDSPFVYRDGIGWPASLPYIRKIHVSVAIWNPSSRKGTSGQNMGVLKKLPKSDNGKVVKIIKVHFHYSSFCCCCCCCCCSSSSSSSSVSTSVSQ